MLKSLSAKVRSQKVRSRTKTVLESLRHSRGLFAVHVSPRMSSNVHESSRIILPQTFAELRGITDNFHNLLPNVRGALSQIFSNPRKSTKICCRIIRGLSRIFEDLRGQQKVRESAADFCGPSRTVLVSECPRESAIRLSAIGISRTFAERYFAYY